MAAAFAFDEGRALLDEQKLKKVRSVAPDSTSSDEFGNNHINPQSNVILVFIDGR